ncbi:PAS domain-containing sensor histidine kinase [Rhodovibrio salinarum]|uniref:histidine kinase n=2 Tax=Rhodovibrio salinarum TaxID=1087 RepID=A0A934QHH1_9PROT|nr:PAS domain-containing sensor histidine kinase [Rhodovibrio salinarum]
MSETSRPARIVRATLWLSAPALGVLAVFLVTGSIAPLPALLGALVVLAGTGGLLARHFRAVAALRSYIDQLRQSWSEDDELPNPPVVDSPGLDLALGQAIADTARERRARRRELRAVVAGNEAVLSGLPDPLLLIDSSGRTVGANPAAKRLFSERVVGRDLATVLRHPDLLQTVDTVLAGGADQEIDFAATSGEIEQHFSARVAALPSRGPDGAVAVCSLHDVTTIKRAEQMRADFVANASHELRTPLSSLTGFIETLQGAAKEDTEARERFLEIMQREAQRMSHLVEDLLSLSRIELDEHTPPTGRTDVRGVLERVQSATEIRAQKKDMTVELDVAGAPAVIGDMDQLTQVFQNLVDNAVKYGRQGTPIRIEAGPADRATGRPSRRARRGVAVSVIDQGDGIPRKHIPRLTERFYRVDTARSRELGGTGLGLAIVKHIVNRHRGQLEIDSAPGEGSRFTVYLPAADGGADQRTEVPAEHAAQ